MIKRLIDIIGATVAIMLFSPIILVTALAIRFDSKGGIIFIQKRIGLNGVPFNMYKFRTMVENAEQMEQGLYSYDDDPRITRIGWFLRQFSLDELPQLFNVLDGSMSLVGPRPPVTYELGDYKDFTDWMKVRFQVKPGITGLAQVSGRNELNWDEKMVFDNQYVETYSRWGVLCDCIILFRTVWVVLSMQKTIEQRTEQKENY